MSVRASRTVSTRPSSSAASSSSSERGIAQPYALRYGLDTGSGTRSSTRVPRLLEDVMDDLTKRLGPADGTAQVLPGGLTNTNFRVRLGDGDYVLRLPGHGAELLGIDRDAEVFASEVAAAEGVGPEVVTISRGCLVTRFIDGRSLDPEDLRDPGLVHDVAVTLRQLHESGRRLPVAFDAFRVVERLHAVARDHGVEAPG